MQPLSDFLNRANSLLWNGPVLLLLAVALGGAGAVFWCWVTGILGMATTYAECWLSMHFKKGEVGGFMAVYENGLKSKKLAKIYAFLTLLAACSMACVTGAALTSDKSSIPFYTEEHELLCTSCIGIAVSLLVGFILIAGARTVAKVCVTLVPAMALLFTGSCIAILFINHSTVLPALSLILRSAFGAAGNFRTIASGVLCGTFGNALRYGTTRGLFTNEAGLGSAALATIDSKETSAHKQALVSMSATFWDTVVICAITGIVIVSSLLRSGHDISLSAPGDLTAYAFLDLGSYGPGILRLCVFSFAIATLIGWSYLAEKAAEYLLGHKGSDIYRLAYLVMIFIGAVCSPALVWELVDFTNALLVVPNVIAMVILIRCYDM